MTKWLIVRHTWQHSLVFVSLSLVAGVKWLTSHVAECVTVVVCFLSYIDWIWHSNAAATVAVAKESARSYSLAYRPVGWTPNANQYHKRLQFWHGYTSLALIKQMNSSSLQCITTTQLQQVCFILISHNHVDSQLYQLASFNWHTLPRVKVSRHPF